MAQQVFPTKGNLIASKKTLSLSTMGYDLMDKKRNILIREMMGLVDQAKQLRDEVDAIYDQAFAALRNANITLGNIGEIAESVPLDDGITIGYRSVMGVDIPTIHCEKRPLELSYGLYDSNSQLDYAFLCFQIDRVLGDHRHAGGDRKRRRRALGRHRQDPAPGQCAEECGHPQSGEHRQVHLRFAG